MVRNFWNPEEIAFPGEGKDIPPGVKECLSFQICCDSILKRDGKSNWFDVEALICFFTHCLVYGDAQTFRPVYNRVQRLAAEVKALGWNNDRDQRCKDLITLQEEVYKRYPDLFVRKE